MAVYKTALTTNRDAGRLPEPAMAQDAAGPKDAANRLLEELTRLNKRWATYFDQLAKRLAVDFTQSAYRMNRVTWQSKLRSAGFTVDLQLTPSQKLILDTKVAENVALIKSIPEKFHTDVQGSVARGFLAGRDLHTMAAEIKQRGDVTVSRAALIARDQANKLTAQMNSARQRELGLSWAYWKHSAAGKEPRVNHVRASREGWIYNTQKGIDFGDGFGYVLPGEAIRCRCTGSTIIPALGRGVPKGRSFDIDKLAPVSGFPGAFKLVY